MRVKRYVRPFALAMLEIREVEKVAAELGEEGIREVLTSVASILTRHTREVDFSARYYNERFVMGLPETDGVGAAMLAKRIIATIEKECKCGVVFGVASLGEDSQTITELYRNAEKMLEEYKE